MVGEPSSTWRSRTAPGSSAEGPCSVGTRGAGGGGAATCPATRSTTGRPRERTEPVRSAAVPPGIRARANREPLGPMSRSDRCGQLSRVTIASPSAPRGLRPALPGPTRSVPWSGGGDLLRGRAGGPRPAETRNHPTAERTRSQHCRWRSSARDPRPAYRYSVTRPRWVPSGTPAPGACRHTSRR